MAKVRQARRCRAKRSDGERCRAFAVTGAEVCRCHGGAAPQVQAAAYVAQFEQWANRLFRHEMERHRKARVKWMARRVAITSIVLGVPVEDVNEAHIAWCQIEHGVAFDPEPEPPPLDRRFRSPQPPRSAPTDRRPSC